LKALASVNAPSDQRAARAWLFKIVQNLWIDEYRRQKVQSEDDAPVAIEGTCNLSKTELSCFCHPLIEWKEVADIRLGDFYARLQLQR
jgi:DNA-directed RNA polymerase specialized sigma24 family protein